MSGMLRGVGVGPGDPELITIKARNAIQSADVIAYPGAEHGSSLARRIAAPYIAESQLELALRYPLTTGETDHPAATRRPSAKRAGVLERGIYVERASSDEERVAPLPEVEGRVPYMSLVLLPAERWPRTGVEPHISATRGGLGRRPRSGWAGLGRCVDPPVGPLPPFRLYDRKARLRHPPPPPVVAYRP